VFVNDHWSFVFTVVFVTSHELAGILVHVWRALINFSLTSLLLGNCFSVCSILNIFWSVDSSLCQILILWSEFIDKIIIFDDLESFSHILTSNSSKRINVSASGAMALTKIRILFLKRFCGLVSCYRLCLISGASVLPWLLGVVEFVNASLRVEQCLGLHRLFLLLVSCSGFCEFNRLVLHFDRKSFHTIPEQLSFILLVMTLLVFPPIAHIEPSLQPFRRLILHIQKTRGRPLIKCK